MFKKKLGSDKIIHNYKLLKVMLDIKFIKENLEKVKKAAEDKNRKVNFERLMTLDEERRKLISEVEKVRAERNKISKQRTPLRQGYEGQAENNEQRDKGKKLKEELGRIEEKLKIVEVEYMGLMNQVPNVPDSSVPVGPDASYNKEIKKWGELPKFEFKPLDHIQLAKKLDLVDFERGAKISGFRGYFLKNEAALMEMGILMHTFKKLVSKGYTPIIAPSLVKEFTLFGSGQFPWGREEVYLMKKDDLYLAGTAEVPVTAYFSGEILNEKDLPKKIVAFSPCFRREAGSYGKETKGLYRLHQFNKVEQVIVNKNDYQGSLELHEELLRNSEEVLQDLKLPYRVMLMSTGDMGEPQVKKYDVETWMPSRPAPDGAGLGNWGETMSNSFMGDFQTRRLNIRYKTSDGVIEYTHSLNNTAVASPRILIAILENYQKKDGSVEVPAILREFVGKDVVSPK